jgi:hypothetical protein
MKARDLISCRTEKFLILSFVLKNSIARAKWKKKIAVIVYLVRYNRSCNNSLHVFFLLYNFENYNAMNNSLH